ncbi:MAG: glucose-6-phosphate dehydrogenase [Planctomycetota bacterium]|nr:MAG: glucose-6-phosphate dehydrogenase [Planctomycetota bacterium]
MLTQIVILGASGDLTSRKLTPAVFNAHCQGLFPGPIQMVGVARREWDDAYFRQHLSDAMPSDQPLEQGLWEEFLQHVSYLRAHLDSEEGYAALAQGLDQLAGGEAVNRVFYLSIKPDLFLPSVRGLHGAGLLQQAYQEPFRRVVVEKPFGTDLQSASTLNRALLELMGEDQLYRIDHYLGKETVQNILAFRFRNAFFEPLWNQKHVDLVQVTVAEDMGVGSRAGYYDESGALRDIVQNHALQLLALVAMEPPANLDADSIRSEKVKVLQSLRPPEAMIADPDPHIVRAQYEGYLQEDGVPVGSLTETYIAARTYIDNWRWGGVPILIRTGKYLPARFTSVQVQFRMPPHSLFGSWAECHLRPNAITLRIQPREGIDVHFEVKEPGSGQNMRPAALTFDYDSLFGRRPEAYQRLLQDVVAGDQSLFIRSDEVEASWRWADGVRQVMDQMPMLSYPPKTWGPKQANALFRECEGMWSKE